MRGMLGLEAIGPACLPLTPCVPPKLAFITRIDLDTRDATMCFSTTKQGVLIFALIIYLCGASYDCFSKQIFRFHPGQALLSVEVHWIYSLLLLASHLIYLALPSLPFA